MAKWNKINHEENVGKKFNRLTILDYFQDGKDFYYKCKCECGNIKNIRAPYILNNNVKSCGCLHNEVSTKKGKKMGLNNRKYENKCTYCGKEKHYAKGLCKNCYNRFLRNGTPDYKIWKSQLYDKKLQ